MTEKELEDRLKELLEDVPESAVKDLIKNLPDYPEETEGSIMARRIRAEANHLSREERERLLGVGMAIIYAPKKS